MPYEITKTDKTLTIKVDLTKSEGSSASGKSEVIATSRGNVDIGNGLKMGLNVYRPR